LSKPGEEMPIQFDANNLTSSKPGTAYLDLSKKDFETKYEAPRIGGVGDSVKKLLDPDYKG
jgi:hypothetical protein